MVLYVDETENEKLFLVAGLLVDSELSIKNAYSRFKKKIKGFRIQEKYRTRLFTEFKSTLLDNEYSRIKDRMLSEISTLDGAIIYSCYIKKATKMNQVLKESVYITLLSAIVGSLEESTTIVFDAFNKPNFEDNIILSIKDIPMVESICPKDSQTEPGLQFIDNICSVLRRYKSENANREHYEIIRDMVKEV